MAWSLPRVQLVRSALGMCQGGEKQGQASGECAGSGLHVAWCWFTVYLPLGLAQGLGAALLPGPAPLSSVTEGG